MKKIIDLLSNYLKCKKWWLVERDLDEEIDNVEPFSNNVEISDNMELAMEFINNNFYENGPDHGETEEYNCAKKHKHKYLAIKHSDKLIGFVKYGSGEVYIRNIRKIVKFDESITFIYAVYIDPLYRGKKLYQYVNTELMKYAKSEGYRYVRAQIDINNKSVIISKSRCRYYKIASFYTVRLMSINISTISMGQIFLERKQRFPLI